MRVLCRVSLLFSHQSPQKLGKHHGVATAEGAAKGITRGIAKGIARGIAYGIAPVLAPQPTQARKHLQKLHGIVALGLLKRLLIRGRSILGLLLLLIGPLAVSRLLISRLLLLGLWALGGQAKALGNVLPLPRGQKRLHGGKIIRRPLLALLVADARGHGIGGRSGMLPVLLGINLPAARRHGVLGCSLHGCTSSVLIQCMRGRRFLNRNGPRPHIHDRKGVDKMKRDIRDFAKGKNTPFDPEMQKAAQAAMGGESPSSMDNVSMDNVSMDNIQEAVNHYGNKSEGELMEELLRARGAGAIDDASLIQVAAKIAPMLSPDQQRKLDGVMRKLRGQS